MVDLMINLVKIQSINKRLKNSGIFHLSHLNRLLL